MRSVFGDAVDCGPVRIRRRRWFPLQPRRVTMAPRGHIHFHPLSANYCDDFATADIMLQGHFIHEMVHVWQSQAKGSWYLPLMRHPFCRYGYTIAPGKRFADYGIEQQAEIVRHAFLMRHCVRLDGKPGLAVYEALLPFET